MSNTMYHNRQFDTPRQPETTAGVRSANMAINWQIAHEDALRRAGFSAQPFNQMNRQRTKIAATRPVVEADRFQMPATQQDEAPIETNPGLSPKVLGARRVQGVNDFIAFMRRDAMDMRK